MYSRKLALSLAKRYRTCPPPGVRNDAKAKGDWDKHLSLCPYCSGGSVDAFVPWEELGAKLGDIFKDSPRARKNTPPAPGDLRFIKQELGMWHEGMFFNPPLVLVLDDTRAVSDDIHVAQTYHDIHLAAPGDLILTKDITGFGDLFVECWNTYTLKAQHMGPSLGNVGSKIVESAKALEKNPMRMPDWAMLPRPLVDHDPRNYFRALEVEVGYVFAARAVSRLMEELEGAGVELIYDSVKDLMKAVKKLVHGVKWPKQNPRTMEEVFTFAQFPTERLALAADDMDTERAPVRLITLNRGRIVSFEPVYAEIVKKKALKGKFVVTGRLQGIPTEPAEAAFICHWHGAAGGVHSPVDVDWDRKAGNFLAAFDAGAELEGRLEMAVLLDLTEK